MQTDLRGKNMITIQEWSEPELTSVLDVGDQLKAEFAADQWAHLGAL